MTLTPAQDDATAFLTLIDECKNQGRDFVLFGFGGAFQCKIVGHPESHCESETANGAILRAMRQAGMFRKESK